METPKKPLAQFEQEFTEGSDYINPIDILVRSLEFDNHYKSPGVTSAQLEACAILLKVLAPDDDRRTPAVEFLNDVAKTSAGDGSLTSKIRAASLLLVAGGVL